MKENDIRPDDLKKNQLECLEFDIRWLLARKKDFVKVECPACASQNSSFVFEKNGFTYDKCVSCETIFTNPRPSEETLGEFYEISENYKYFKDFIFPASEKTRREKIFRPRAEKIIAICKDNGIEGGTLFEVGAGFGTFCEEISGMAFFDRVVAVEPGKELSETCRKRGIEVIKSPIEKVELEDEAVDVIVNFEVIEHLFCPKRFLEGCASKLKSGGLLVTTCPNSKGFDIQTLQEASDSVDHEHINYFTPESLADLIGSFGFEVMTIETPGKLDVELVRKKVLLGEFDIAKLDPFIRQILFDRWDSAGAAFQDFISNNMFSSHMWIVARKKGDHKNGR